MRTKRRRINYFMIFGMLLVLTTCVNNPNYKKTHDQKKREKHVKKTQKQQQRKLEKIRNK